MNAANEGAVAAFLDRRIGFLDIARVVAETLERMDGKGLIAGSNEGALDGARLVDATARHVADEVVNGLMARA